MMLIRKHRAKKETKFYKKEKGFSPKKRIDLEEYYDSFRDAEIIDVSMNDENLRELLRRFALNSKNEEVMFDERVVVVLSDDEQYNAKFNPGTNIKFKLEVFSESSFELLQVINVSIREFLGISVHLGLYYPEAYRSVIQCLYNGHLTNKKEEIELENSFEMQLQV